MAPTNNKPCAQHTETSGGRSGHISKTVTHLADAYIQIIQYVSFLSVCVIYLFSMSMYQ